MREGDAIEHDGRRDRAATFSPKLAAPAALAGGEWVLSALFYHQQYGQFGPSLRSLPPARAVNDRGSVALL